MEQLDLIKTIPPEVLEVLNALEAAGFAAYCVGGSVRDTLMAAMLAAPTIHTHSQPSIADYDITSSAKPDQLAAALPGYRLIDTGSAYGTMTVIVGANEIQITTFRADGEYTDGRHPDSVIFSTEIEADLSRRDFTINAMAYSPVRGLVDPFGGQADLASKTLRAVGNASERLAEDGLRIMRALRFAATLGFMIDEELAEALHQCKHLLAKVSVERIQVELMKLLTADGENLVPVLREYADVLSVAIPEIAPMIGFEQHSPWHIYDVWEHTVQALAVSDSGDKFVRLALLLHDIGKPPTFTLDEDGRGHFYAHAPVGADMAFARLQAMHFGNRTIDLTCELIRTHFATITPDIIRRWLRRLGEEQLRRLLAIKLADYLASSEQSVQHSVPEVLLCIEALNRAIEEDACFTLAQMEINGDDLIALGVDPGPGLGQILETLLTAIVDGELLNEHQQLLEAARRLVE